MPERRRSESQRGNVIEHGFSLIELLIVVMVLGILAAIVVLAVGTLSDTATHHACATEMTTFESAIQTYKAQHAGALPAGADTPSVATSLVGANLLASANLGFSGAGASQWAYNVGTGAVTPGASCN